jgi:hypothetical protein
MPDRITWDRIARSVGLAALIWVAFVGSAPRVIAGDGPSCGTGQTECDFECCDDATEVCTSDPEPTCCAQDRACQGRAECCSEGEVCTDDDGCCAAGLNCGSECCEVGEECTGDGCCAQGTGCNGVECCGLGETCTQFGDCCAQERACGDECCRQDETCFEDECVPAPTDTPTVTPSATPTSTPSATPTVTPSATPTVTPTTTPTATPTAVPLGGSCADASECAAGVPCVEGICGGQPAPAPTASRAGLLVALALLAGIGGLTILRRRAATH